MKVLLESWRKYLKESVQTAKDKGGNIYNIISRDDGKTVLVADGTFKHIGTHGKVGAGSVFSGQITPEMIIDFVKDRAPISATGGFVTADFASGGYELVKPMSWVKENLPDAEIRRGTKEEFQQGKKVQVPVLNAITSEPINSKKFVTDEVSVGIFKYDPDRSSPEQNELIKSSEVLSAAEAKGNLFALATAFPGGFKIEGIPVPRASEWKDEWAVIIPKGT
jgi:hypothetical protein